MMQSTGTTNHVFLSATPTLYLPHPFLSPDITVNACRQQGTGRSNATCTCAEWLDLVIVTYCNDNNAIIVCCTECVARDLHNVHIIIMYM